MKPHLLLLHGALGSKQQLEPIKQQLQDTFEVHSIDFEGHASHVSDAEYTMQLFTQNVIDYLDQNNIESTHIFGYSMGGYVALYTAIRHPKKVQKIVTLGTKFNWNPETAEKEVRMLNPDKIAEKVPKYAAHLEQLHAPQDWREVLHKTGRMMMRLSEKPHLPQGDLRKLTHPVTIGLGSLDKMVSVDESEQVANVLPNATFTVLEGVEHPIDRVDPQVLTAFVCERLRQDV